MKIDMTKIQELLKNPNSPVVGCHIWLGAGVWIVELGLNDDKTSFQSRSSHLQSAIDNVVLKVQGRRK